MRDLQLRSLILLPLTIVFIATDGTVQLSCLLQRSACFEELENLLAGDEYLIPWIASRLFLLLVFTASLMLKPGCKLSITRSSLFYLLKPQL